ncbi:fibronectin type III domain-containing protein [Planomonospora algeriensis]
MSVAQSRTYNAGDTGARSSHTITFSPATAGNWLVVMVSSGVPVTGTTGGYEQQKHVGSGFSMRLYTKKADGGESSFTASTSISTIKVHISMVEVIGPMELSGTLAKTGSGGTAFNDTMPRSGGVMVGGAALLSAGSYASISWPGQVDREWSMATPTTDGGSTTSWHVSSAAYETGISASYAFSGATIPGTFGFAAAVFFPEVPPDEQAPSMPGDLRLTKMTPTSVTVAWDASGDDTGVAGYTTYLNGVEKSSTSSRSATFSGLTPGVSVTISVDAYDYAGNRSEKAEITITPINDTTPPLTPVIRVTGLGAGKISVAWDTPFDQSAVTGYGVYLNGQKQGSDQTGRTRTFTGLTAGAVYTIGVDALDLLGNRSARGTRTVRAQADTSPPTMPGAVQVVATSKTAITLAWNASTDDNVGVTGYGLYLGGLRVAEIPSRVYTFTGLTPGVTYTVGVDATDELGNRTARTMLQATTLADLSGAAPPYEYVLYDWDSHLPIDSLPLQNVSFEVTLGGGGA